MWKDGAWPLLFSLLGRLQGFPPPTFGKSDHASILLLSPIGTI
jgi:hypothetical protein